MKTVSFGNILISLVALWAAGGSYIFDWNATHIYNPHWPPHAKFHNAQTMLLGTVIGLTSLLILWNGKAKDQLYTLRIASVLASYYWLTQIGAILFPGTALIDPEFVTHPMLPYQLIVDAVMLSLLLGGYLLELHHLKNMNNEVNG